jgi:hypothetical protein
MKQDREDKMIKTTNEISINEVITKAQKREGEQDIYANHAQVAITNNEIFIDFYYVAPDIGKVISAKATHVQRMIIPLSLGKGLASAIANTVATFEAENSTSLPNYRGIQEGDKIKIWE